MEPIAKFEVSELVLYNSTLQAGPPVYTAQHVALFKNVNSE